jgi:hypothetical protein
VIEQTDGIQLAEMIEGVAELSEEEIEVLLKSRMM